MADAPDKKRELALRGDFRIKWKKGAGQFEEPVDPVAPTEVGGQILPVHYYLDPSKIGPTDELAPQKNEDNNQERIDKIKVSPIRFYVKAPAGDSHHDDYSYHSPPWDSSSGSSGSSSSPPYGSVPSVDPQSAGQSTPPATNTDPLGTTPDPSNGEVTMAPLTNAPTQQVQFGGAPPQSPGLTQRFNVLEKLAGVNPTALRTFRKIQGFSDIQIELIMKPSDPIPGGSSIQINLILIPFTGLKAPTEVYRKAFVLDSTWTQDWRRYQIPFRGFTTDAIPITFAIERRNDVSPNDEAEVWVMETIFRGLR